MIDKHAIPEGNTVAEIADKRRENPNIIQLASKVVLRAVRRAALIHQLINITFFIVHCVTVFLSENESLQLIQQRRIALPTASSFP